MTIMVICFNNVNCLTKSQIKATDLLMKNLEIQNTDETEEIQVQAMKSRDTLIKTPEAGNSPLSESSKAVINISDDEERVKIPRKPVFSANQNSGSWTNEMVERQIKERMQPGSSLLTP